MKYITGILLLLVLSSGCSSLRFKSDEELRTSGNEAYVNGRYEEATPYYDELIRRDEEDVNARLKRARTRDLAGNPLAAREDYSSALEVAPDDSRARLYRAELSIRNGDLDAAESDLTHMIGQGAIENYDRVAAYKFLGNIQTKRNKLGAAVGYYRQGISAAAGTSDPTTMEHLAEVHYNLGHCLYAQNRIPDSHQEFVAYAQIAPRAGQVLTGEDYYLLGITAHLSGQIEQARQYLAKADPSQRARAAQVLNDPFLASKQSY